ncbi:hypothetical protein [Pseudoalteromonas xiamenensis]|uniref:Lipoprotein n=1 Tax=Pseudoalteromonas xiamenensis TaxID=882626 RepID=A0A975HMT5_9GAMM|nr:hypothetical protein [Pseudoalteromonas xiamenensis]QTH73448.1 hypothetical protein J5O05_18285 [Pseudoalteromonas xiamenensis]WMN61786.1 hypothetical protein NI389_18430 [Pseudoalteromonas xiamenensis]
MRNTLVALSLCSLLAACAHHDDVRPSENNTHYVAVNSQQKEEGGREAMKQAKHYCESIKKQMYVINEEVVYQGSTPESEYLSNLKTADIVSNVGTVLWIFGDGRVDDAGGIAAITGESVKASMGKPYITKMHFKCD